MRLSFVLSLLVAGSSQVAAFSTASTSSKSAVVRFHAESPQQVVESEEGSGAEEISPVNDKKAQRPSTIYIPVSFDEMVKQASSTMQDAMKAGIKRQTLRILLPRSSDNDQIGQYYEKSVTDPDPNIYVDTVLVPPDETWQGGIMQLYRAASLACQEILRYVIRYLCNAKTIE